MTVAYSYETLKDARHKRAKAHDHCAAWLDHLDAEGYAERTISDYERTVAVLLRTYPDLDITEFTDVELTKILVSFPPGSRRKCRAHLGSFMGWAKSHRKIAENPMEYVARPRRTARKIIETFTDLERDILENLPDPDGILFKVLFHTGIRKGEARRLRLRHFDFERGTVTIYDGKGGKDRVIPVRKLAQPVLDWALTNGINPDDHLWFSRPGGGKINRRVPIGEGSFHRWYAECLKRAGVTHRKPHTTRHSYATNWLRKGSRLETLSKTLGHESIKTTFDEYAHLDISDLALDMELAES